MYHNWPRHTPRIPPSRPLVWPPAGPQRPGYSTGPSQPAHDQLGKLVRRVNGVNRQPPILSGNQKNTPSKSHVEIFFVLEGGGGVVGCDRDAVIGPEVGEGEESSKSFQGIRLKSQIATRVLLKVVGKEPDVRTGRCASEDGHTQEAAIRAGEIGVLHTTYDRL